MLFGELIDEVLDRLKLDKNDLNNRDIVGRKVNLAYKEIANNSNIVWECLKKTGLLLTTPNYNTGSCTVTNGQFTVTFTGTFLTDSYEGRYVQIQGSSDWYKIVKVVTTSQVNVSPAIALNTGSGLTFTIWKRFYYLPSEVKQVLEFGSWIRDGILTDISQSKLRDLTTNIAQTGDPKEFIMLGIDQLESEYTTGTASVTVDSNVLTGALTSFLSNVEAGDLIEVGGDSYRVKRVETDTSIVMINHAKNTLSGSSYSIKKTNNFGLQLWYNPGTQLVLEYLYQKRIFDMVNEINDRTELTDDFDRAILDLAEAERLSDLDSQKYAAKIQIARARIIDLKRIQNPSIPKHRQFRPLIKSRGEYITWR